MSPIGLRIEKAGANPTAMWTSTERLYLNKDRTTVVPEGSTEAASLLCPVGGQVPDADCQRYGLGPYAVAQDATQGDTGAEEPEGATDTESESKGPQIDSQDAGFSEADALGGAERSPRRKR